jgi:hypothetical protein
MFFCWCPAVCQFERYIILGVLQLTNLSAVLIPSLQLAERAHRCERKMLSSWLAKLFSYVGLTSALQSWFDLVCSMALLPHFSHKVHIWLLYDLNWIQLINSHFSFCLKKRLPRIQVHRNLLVYVADRWWHCDECSYAKDGSSIRKRGCANDCGVEMRNLWVSVGLQSQRV